MLCRSTRGGPLRPLEEVLATGCAPDGGLYAPSRWPLLDGLRAQPTLAATAKALLSAFFERSRLASVLPGICRTAFSFPAPLRLRRAPGDWMLELFHGPTAAFKDYAARFLAEALDRLRDPHGPEKTVLVATSGDTGAAVASAFHGRTGFRVLLVCPEQGVSAVQAHMLGSFGSNVRAFRVAGDFDTCQRLVQEALADPTLTGRYPLVSANSLGLGRLLPQIASYAHAACAFHEAFGERLNFIVPTGNLGNATACVAARTMGLPVGEIVLSLNDNRTLPDFFAGAPYRPRPSIPTLANAMDVGAPGNFERLLDLVGGSERILRQALGALHATDEEIRAAIGLAARNYGIEVCPHAATGLHALRFLRAGGDSRPWAVVATAHPAKFPEIVQAVLGRKPRSSSAVDRALARPARSEPLAGSYSALRERLLEPDPSDR